MHLDGKLGPGDFDFQLTLVSVLYFNGFTASGSDMSGAIFATSCWSAFEVDA
jgi:hypothetical protein